jgi:hypothetical protein
MSPLRWDVLSVGLLLALPVLALGLRGELTADEVALRLPWCLVAAWAAVALLRWAVGSPRPSAEATPDATAPAEDRQPAS